MTADTRAAMLWLGGAILALRDIGKLYETRVFSAVGTSNIVLAFFMNALDKCSPDLEPSGQSSPTHGQREYFKQQFDIGDRSSVGFKCLAAPYTSTFFSRNDTHRRDLPEDTLASFFYWPLYQWCTEGTEGACMTQRICNASRWLQPYHTELPLLLEKQFEYRRFSDFPLSSGALLGPTNKEPVFILHGRNAHSGRLLAFSNNHDHFMNVPNMDNNTTLAQLASACGMPTSWGTECRTPINMRDYHEMWAESCTTTNTIEPSSVDIMGSCLILDGLGGTNCPALPSTTRQNHVQLTHTANNKDTLLSMVDARYDVRDPQDNDTSEFQAILRAPDKTGFSAVEPELAIQLTRWGYLCTRKKYRPDEHISTDPFVTRWGDRYNFLHVLYPPRANSEL